MAAKQELEVQQKREIEGQQETTMPARFFAPNTDIFETKDALKVVMEMPGVSKKSIDVTVEKGVLTVEGRIDFSNYDKLDPVYSEYNVGHFRRNFSLSNKIDQSKISADLRDGVLELSLPKAEEAKPRTVKVN